LEVVAGEERPGKTILLLVIPVEVVAGAGVTNELHFCLRHYSVHPALYEWAEVERVDLGGLVMTRPVEVVRGAIYLLAGDF
jgi:hypothetical protein